MPVSHNLPKADLLVFAAHPDDAELSCGGVILDYTSRGKTVALVDLTRGEMGTRGTKEIRAQEAQKAGELLGISYRENLGLPDGHIRDDDNIRLSIAGMIRKYRPDVILANAYEDRHPDHGGASAAVESAVFWANLKNIEIADDNGQLLPHHKAKLVLHYIQDRYIKPDVIVDITQHMDKKMEAIKAFKSQFFDPNSTEPTTYISSPEFWEGLYSRAREMGRLIGVKYGEGFNCRRSIGVSSINNLV